jgi:multicomponent Na+:H+ antiporter subunit E
MKHRIAIVIVFMAIWIVMNESAHPVVLVSSVPIAIATMFFSDRVIDRNYASEFYLSPWTAARYIAVLLGQIVIAAWGMAKVILSGKGETRYFEYHSDLTDDLLLTLLSNSIIMTPGSVAVDRDGSTITVMAVGDVETARRTCRTLERSVAKLGRS